MHWASSYNFPEDINIFYNLQLSRDILCPFQDKKIIVMNTWTSIDLYPHGYVTVPLDRFESNKTCCDRRSQCIVRNCIRVLISNEHLSRNISKPIKPWELNSEKQNKQKTYGHWYSQMIFSWMVRKHFLNLWFGYTFAPLFPGSSKEWNVSPLSLYCKLYLVTHW